MTDLDEVLVFLEHRDRIATDLRAERAALLAKAALITETLNKLENGAKDPANVKFARKTGLTRKIRDFLDEHPGARMYEITAVCGPSATRTIGPMVQRGEIVAKDRSVDRPGKRYFLPATEQASVPADETAKDEGK